MENLFIICQRRNHLRWNNTYSLGIKLIDDQHMKILDFARDLINYTPKSDEDRDTFFKEAIEKVVEYIKTHFATEEGIMIATRFPGYEEHKKAHESFILSVVRYIKDYEAGNRQVLTNFSHFTRKWVLTHIAILDVKYIEYYKKITINR